MTNIPWRRALRYSGLALLAIGIVTTAFVVVSIRLNQSNCQGGEGPVPDQGCGYVPELILFGPADQFPMLLSGLYLTYLGGVVLVLGWLARTKKAAPTT